MLNFLFHAVTHFFLFVPENKICMIRINRMLYMIKEMSIKCLLDVPFWTVAKRPI